MWRGPHVAHKSPGDTGDGKSDGGAQRFARGGKKTSGAPIYSSGLWQPVELISVENGGSMEMNFAAESRPFSKPFQVGGLGEMRAECRLVA